MNNLLVLLALSFYFISSAQAHTIAAQQAAIALNGAGTTVYQPIDIYAPVLLSKKDAVSAQQAALALNGLGTTNVSLHY